MRSPAADRKAQTEDNEVASRTADGSAHCASSTSRASIYVATARYEPSAWPDPKRIVPLSIVATTSPSSATLGRRRPYTSATNEAARLADALQPQRGSRLSAARHATSLQHKLSICRFLFHHPRHKLLLALQFTFREAESICDKIMDRTRMIGDKRPEETRRK